MSTKFLSPGWRMPRNANQSKSSNYSLERTGANQYIQADSISIDSGPSFTISCWVFGADIDTSGLHAFWGTEHYGTSTGGFVIYYGSGGVTFYASLPGSGSYFSFSTANNLLVDNVWQQVTIRYNYGVDYRIYINNVLRAVNTTNNSITWPEQNIRLFRHYSNDGYDHDGALSDWCFFNYALSDTATSVGDTTTGQMAQLYGDGSSLPNPMALARTPIAYYPLGKSAWNGEYLVENNAIGDYVFGFNGINDYIGFGNLSVFEPTSNYTFSIWFNSGSYVYKTLFGDTSNAFAQGILALLRSSSALDYYHNTTSTYKTLTLSLTDFPVNTWHNLTITWSASTGILRGFIDGKFNAQLTGVNDVEWGNISLELGRYYNTFYYDSKLSNFVMWDATLTDGFSGTPTAGDIAGGQVAEVYNNGTPQTTITGAPIGWWKLDASELYSNTWSIENNASPTNFKSALDFDGTNDYIDTNFTLPASYTSYSYSIWYKQSSSFTGDNYLIGNWNQGSSAIADMRVSVRFNGGTKLRFITGNNTTAFQSTDLDVSSLLLDGNWHHIAVTVVSGEIKLYIDKNLEATHSNSNIVTGIVANRSYTLGFSGNTSYAGYLDNSQLSNFQIFNTALSATGSNSVETLYNNGSPLTSMSGFTSLQGWWKLDNTTTGIEDSAGSNNGTNNGTTEIPTYVNTTAGTMYGSVATLPAALQQSDLNFTSGYSSYAMNFDGTDYIETNGSVGVNIGNTFTTSAWVNLTGFGGAIFGGTDYVMFIVNSGEVRIKFYGYSKIYTSLTTTLSTGKWYHFLFARTGETGELFINGVSQGPASNLGINDFQFKYIGARATSLQLFNGKISNAAVWNTALTASQVREIYNQGLPSNLNTFSGTAPIHWWQLGENSSYVSGWTFADEIGSNNVASGNLPETALTNGVGTTANGTSTGISEGSLVGDAPYSTANAISSGMAVTARGTNVP